MPSVSPGRTFPSRPPRGAARRLARLVTVPLVLLALDPASGSRRPWLECATGKSSAASRSAALAPGALLGAIQTPEVVHYAFEGPVQFELAVMGDFESIGFRIDSFEGTRTFSAERQSSFINAQGQVVSRFEVEGTLAEWIVLPPPFSWNVDVTVPILPLDLLYLGPEGNEQPIFLPLTVLPKKLPGSKIVRRNKRFQYGSNVVNVAISDLHARQLDQLGSLGFEPEAVVALVEEELGPTEYDEYGFGLWQHNLTNTGAFHRNRGAGEWSMSLYGSNVIPVFGLWKHEIGHNWNFYYDLPRLVGWDAPYDGAHSRGPLAEDPGLLCGSAYPVRKVDGKWRTVWIRDRHPFHPLELFAMGLLEPSEVPETIVFKRQNQRDFHPDLRIRGPRRSFAIEELIEEYGMPKGAGKKVWRVAPVIVSAKLLPRKLLSRINFFMRRIEDPEGEAPGSFDRSTGGRMDLKTSIETGDRRRARPPRKVTFPPIGKNEIPGITLSKSVPTCIEVGDELVVEGSTDSGEIPDLVMIPSNPASREIGPQLSATNGGGFRAVFSPNTDDDYRLELGALDDRLPLRFGPIYVTDRCTKK